MKNYLEFKDEKSSKFWSIEVSGDSFTVIYGKIGTNGSAQTKSFANADEALKEAKKQLNSKLKKGYVEATAPDSLGMEVKTKKVPATQKEAKKKTPKIREIVVPDDAIDDGTIQPWQSEESDFWEDGFDDETFDRLREPETIKPAAKEPQADGIIKEFDETEYSRHLNKMKKSGRNAHLNEFLKELEIVKQYAVLAREIEPDKASYHTPIKDYYKFNLANTLEQIKDNGWFKPEHIKIVETLLKEVTDLEVTHKENVKSLIKKGLHEESSPEMWKYVIGRCKEDTDYTKTALYFDEYLTSLFKKSTDIAINLIYNLIQKIKNGEHPKFEGQKTLSSDFRGLEVYLHDYDKVVIYGITDDGRKNLAEEELKGINDFDKSIVPVYALDYFKSSFNEKIDKAELNSISSGIMEVKVEGVKDAIYFSKTESDEIKQYNKEILNKAELLENSENWEKDSEMIDKVVKHLVYYASDSERALNIIKRFLYCGDTTAEENAIEALSKYDDDDRHIPWWFERAVYWWNNFDYDWSLRTIRKFALEDKYPPAVQFYNNLLAEGVITDKVKSGDENEEHNTDYYTKEFGYGSQAEIQEFLDKFTEEDKFKETDNVIMRAYSDARVFIRFKKETEQAYSEALDFLLHLINKGYTRIFDGYQLCVRFVAKPEYIKDIDLPDTETNAFFARAVRYPTLHEKIREYVLQGMHMFDRYHDLNGDERNTVVGAFAASALSLIDKKHLDLAIKYGKEADGEHEEIQLELAHALEKVYGVDKETAPAIYELIMSYDHLEHKVKDTFYKDPEVLETLTQYLYQNDSHDKGYRVVRFMGCLFSRGGLNAKMKALKAFYDNAANTETKNIYAGFYNLIIDCDANSNYSELKLEHLEYAGEAVRKDEKPIEELTLKEEIPVVTNIKDAEKRKEGKLKDIEISKEEGRHFLVFFGVVSTDLRFVEHIVEQFRKACNRDIYKKIGNGSFGGNCLFELDEKWFIDLSATPYQNGICIYNGKDKPVMLYGTLNYIDLLIKTGKRKIKEEEIAILMETYAVPGIQTPLGGQLVVPECPALKYIETVVSGIFSAEYNTSLINIEKIKPEDGEYYKSALVYNAFIMETKLKNAAKYQLKFDKDKEALKLLYGQLLEILPEHKDYWQEKLQRIA